MEAEHEQTLVRLLRRSRYEVIPLDGVEEDVAEHVPRSVRLTVTASPGKGIDTTLRLSERLSRRGFEAVPHISARLVTDESHLEDILRRLADHGIREAFVVAGDVEEPAGAFEGASALLAAMSRIGHRLDRIGITGYPESHPVISDETTIEAMFEKEPMATYIVSQICFEPRTTAGWVRRVRRRGVKLPIYIGIPGPVPMLRLLRVSRWVGIGESARFLNKHGNRLARLFLPGGYRPDRLAEELAPHAADPDNKIHGFHFYTFNEVEETERWRQAALGRLLAKRDGSGDRSPRPA
ncbi:MAG: methylenetetrahydrofolate reductase [Actinobacteria bacterium]|nr:methylenetetrahydrofolate reductase [Actinomycetota bacterium]